jgi:hypothetical protein
VAVDIALKPDNGGVASRDVRLAMYAPEDGGVNDHCIVRTDDGWHYFFIYREYEKAEQIFTPPQENKIGHAFSKDLFTWRSCPPAVKVRPGTWESKGVWAPHVIRKHAYWYMAYAGVDDNDVQRLGIVRSKDLHHWERYLDKWALDASDFEWFEAGTPYWSDYHCRDPYLLLHQSDCLMYYTARAVDNMPCIAAARSSDMVHWEDLGPVIRMVYDNLNEPGRTPLESCCVFERQGLWYLVYQLRGIRYHISKDPLNWHDTPAHTFSTKMWLFRWADMERNIHIYKTKCFFGVLRFGLVKWEGERMLPDHGINAARIAEESKRRATIE